MIVMELNATIREQGNLTALRSAGFVPGVVYGKKTQAVSIQVRESDLKKAFEASGENVLIDLKINDVGKEETKKVLIYEMQKDPIKDFLTHVDFYAVRMDETVKAKIPVTFQGEAPAIKEQGGILVKAIDEIEVEALPKDLPKEFIVDLSGLKNIADSIYVRDIAVFPNVKIFTPESMSVVSIIAQQAEEAPAAEAPGIADIKTEQEIKKELKEKDKEKGEEEGSVEE